MNNDNKNTLPLWAETQKRNSPALTNISFALVNPQGPMNVGSCARVMQNFGIYDLKIVQGSSFVFEPPPDDDSSDDDDDDDINDKNDEKKNRRTTTQYEDKDEASETEGEMPDLFTASLLTSNKDAKKTMSGEAYRFACAADWMLERASKEAWYPDVKSATADRTVVFATTARNRDGSQPMLDSREACRKAAKLALDGEKVSFLFGNERVGLTNEELRTAQYLVAIPTAGVGEVCGKSLKYTGSSGPTSLNLSHAVGVVAYEAFVETTLEEDRRRKSGHGSSSSSSSGRRPLEKHERKHTVTRRRRDDAKKKVVVRAMPPPSTSSGGGHPAETLLDESRGLYEQGERMQGYKKLEQAMKLDEDASLPVRREIRYQAMCCVAAFGDVEMAKQYLREMELLGLPYDVAINDPSLMRMESSALMRNQLKKFASGSEKSFGTVQREVYERTKKTLPGGPGGDAPIVNKGLMELEIDDNTDASVGGIAKRVGGVVLASIGGFALLFFAGLKLIQESGY